MHREVLRTQGRLNTQFKYDRNSRLQHKQIWRNQNPILPDILIEHSYQYDNLDRLVSKKHSKHGQTDYYYDRTGRIEGCRNQRYWETLQYDAAANLLDHRRPIELDPSNQNVIRCNQLLHFREHRYRYDEHGRTQTKQTIGAIQHYHYDAEHRLSEVRIEQTDRSLYIYTDQNSYEPLARIDKRGNDPEKVMYFHTDLNGAPEEFTTANSDIVWECSFQLWGKRIHEIEHEPIEQNLRYQG
uniref:RHS repeat domain-containing protein n=1 Tax=Gilliamella sp. Nev6-6 TaxID=3120252 RepID=UPI000A40D711|nr:RHS domain-containing protein [Gilliamella apicola]